MITRNTSIQTIKRQFHRHIFDKDVKTPDEFAAVINNVNGISETFINDTSNQGGQGTNLGLFNIGNPQ